MRRFKATLLATGEYERLKPCITREDDQWCWLDPDCRAAAIVMPAKSRGLGDTVAKITTAIGIEPCEGCKKRQQKWNALVPYGSR